MGALAGFILGYALGMKQGPEGFEKLRTALDHVIGSPEAKALVERAQAMIPRFDGAGGAGGANGDGRPEIGGDHLIHLVRTVADSDAIRAFIGGGLEFAKGLFERAVTRGRDM